MRVLPSFRRTVAVAALWSLSVILVSCDSGSDDEGNLFVGNWTVTGVAINEQNVTPFILGPEIQSIGATFTADREFELTVIAGGEQTTTSGSYALDADNAITFSSDSFQAPVAMNYERSGSDRIVLTSTDATLLAELSGIDFSELGFDVERVDVTISRVE